jgi:curved DNA-binding protein CbpA
LSEAYNVLSDPVKREEYFKEVLCKCPECKCDIIAMINRNLVMSRIRMYKIELMLSSLHLRHLCLQTRSGRVCWCGQRSVYVLTLCDTL